MSISFVAAPRAAGPRIPFVRRLKADSILQAQLGCKEPVWCFVHWTGPQKTKVCQAVRELDGTVIDDKPCDHCRAHRPERQKGYLWIFNYATKAGEWLEITPFCWDCICTQGMNCPDLRGWELKLTRGKGEKARFFVQLTEPRPSTNVNGIRPPDNLSAALMKLMGE